MRFKVTYQLPVPISVIIDDAQGLHHALEQANLIEEVRFALACSVVDQEWKDQGDGSSQTEVSVDVELLPDIEPEPRIEGIV